LDNVLYSNNNKARIFYLTLQPKSDNNFINLMRSNSTNYSYLMARDTIK
jgi:hypothetical protein